MLEVDGKTRPFTSSRVANVHSSTSLADQPKKNRRLRLTRKWHEQGRGGHERVHFSQHHQRRITHSCIKKHSMHVTVSVSPPLWEVSV